MRTLPKTISEQDFLAGLKKVKDNKIKLAFMLGFYQGMRISEVVGLQKQVSRCCKADVTRKKEGKQSQYYCSGCNSSITLSTALRAKGWQIQPLMPSDVDIERGFIHLKAAKGGKDRDVPIMEPVKNGLKHLPIGIGRRELQNKVKKFFPGMKFHDLRHSAATFYLNEKKVDIRLIQQLLGHSRLDTTQLYTHITPINMKDRFDEVWR